MSKASANRTTVYSVKEVTWGTTPATPALQEVRFTGEQLDASQTFEKSKEIRSDRMVSDTVQVDESPAGSINIEMSGLTYDDLIEGAMMSAWSAQLAIVGVAADISTVAAPTDNLTSATAGKFNDIVVGQWIKLSGFTNAVNGYYKVTAKTSGVLLTVSPAPTAAETPLLALANIDGSYIRNGVTEQSWTLVKVLNDATVATRQIFRGMRVGGLSLDFSTGAILTGSVNFMGKSSEWTESTFAGETVVPATSTEVMNSVTDVQDIQQNGAALSSTGSLLQLGLEIDNQHREQKAIGVLGNAGVAAGQLVVNATAQQYFETKAQADLFTSATSFSFNFRVTGQDGYTYIFTLPKCKYESFVVNAGALDTDIMADAAFTALRDATTNCMLQIDRFAP